MITETPPTSRLADRPFKRAPAHIPLRRIVAVELRKSFDTRAGRWLLAGIGIAAVLTTAAVIAFAPADDFRYSTFTTTIAFPMSVILPIVAALAVTAEWSQRSGLTTFTVVPNRGRVMLGKTIGVLAIAIPATVVAFVVGAAGNGVASRLTEHDTVWDQDLAAVPYLLLSMTLTMAVGFACGTLIRNSAGAIVAFFVFSFVVPPILGLLAVTEEWFRDVQPWVDLDYQLSALQRGGYETEQWLQVAATSCMWLLLPFAVGLWTLLRSEVK